MSTRALLNFIDRAVAQGLLPADARAQATTHHARPWPVVVLTFIGAFLAAIPLAGFFLLLFEPMLREHVTYYVLGALLIGLGLVLLHARSIPLFFEQWGVIAFATGFGLLWFVLMDDLEIEAGNAVVTVLALGLAFAMPATWMRASLALLASVAFAIVWLNRDYHGAWYESSVETTLRVRLVILAMVALWWAGVALVDRMARNGSTDHAQRLAPVLDGWLVGTLGLVILSVGNTFLMGSFGGQIVTEIGEDIVGRGVDGVGAGIAPQALSALCALAAGGVLLRAWTALRTPLGAGLVIGAAVLSWAITALGAVLLVAAVAAQTQRHRMAILACVVVAWAIGAFYYLLAMPLATKALLLAAVGAGIGAMTWIEARRQGAHAPAPAFDASTQAGVQTADPAPAPTGRFRLDFNPRGAAVWALVGLIATLGVANAAIWGKERLIAHGRTVLVELAPADPRSLMQGDFMALNFRVPNPEYTPADTFGGKRPKVVAKLDARGVAKIETIADGTPPGPDEVLIELTPSRRNDWVLVTDAWFFREGDGERWSRARYGEFRVLPDGRALLVGMADAELRRIE